MDKQTSSANRLVLRRILAQDGNKKCADCKTATHPRWASWNIGVLICIRCSGVHRSLGTHISKVRSIDLDTWNDTQLEKLVEYGNTRANAFWEAQLPENYVPDESKMHNFIRTKYELRRWTPNSESISASKTSGSTPAPPKSNNIRAHFVESPVNESHNPPPLPPKVRSTNLLDLSDAFSLKSVSKSPAPPDPLFGDFTSAKPAPVLSKPLQTQNYPQNQPSNRADVKKSILSLYAQPSPSSAANRASYSSPNLPSSSTQKTATNSQISGPNSGSLNSTNSLNGLSLGGSSSNIVDEDDDSFSNVWN